VISEARVKSAELKARLLNTTRTNLTGEGILVRREGGCCGAVVASFADSRLGAVGSVCETTVVLRGDIVLQLL